MSRTKVIVRNVAWLSEEIPSELNFSNSFRFYQKFQFKDIIGEIGDYVLISNTDAAEPDTEGGCDAAKILTLYEDQSNKNDPFRAKVQWYSRPSGLPKACNMDNIVFYDREDTDETLNEKLSYICRYRLMPVGIKKFHIEPVLDDERKALQLLITLTPTLPMRTHAVGNIEEILTGNKSLPGREKQTQEILSFVRSKLLNSVSGCMYISGVPGTGKTATVNSALKVLKEEPDVPEFQLVEVNGMSIAEPRQAYVEIYKQLTGKSVVWEQACSRLEKRFQTPAPRRTQIVLVIEELDALCDGRQDVIYSIVEWANHDTALLTILAVANTMNLPERALGPGVASRLGLTRVTFPPYNHIQLQRIIATSPAGANITAGAVYIIARKVAAVSGDARRALSLCSRASEIAGPNCVGLEEVEQALGEAVSGATVRVIRNCSPAEKLMLRAVAAEAERTGSDVTTLSHALAAAAAIVAVEGRPYRSAPSIRAPTPSQAHTICARLAATKLLLMEPKAFEPRLSLNVCVDDVHYATK